MAKMTAQRSAYRRWLAFIARPSSVSGIVFPSDEAKAIMALSEYADWRRDKREINKAARKARANRPTRTDKERDAAIKRATKRIEATLGKAPA